MGGTPTDKSISDDDVSVEGANSDGFVERLKTLVGDGSARSFAQRAKLPPSSFQAIMEGKRPGLDNLIAIADAAKVSLDWLARGKEFGGNAGVLGEGYVMVPRYDVTASFGAGTLVDRERILDHMAFREEWIRGTLQVEPKDLALISGKGDSMEPTIRNGDLLLINLGIRRFVDDAIYAIVVRGELKVKRLQQLIDGTVVIRSDNPAYGPEPISPDLVDDLHVAGRVIWIARYT